MIETRPNQSKTGLEIAELFKGWHFGQPFISSIEAITMIFVSLALKKFPVIGADWTSFPLQIGASSYAKESMS